MKKKKNVIIILADSVRADLFLGKIDKLLNLKRIASQGTLFKKAYTTSCWTKPAIASLFTGLNVHHHSIKTPEDTISKSTTTLSKKMKESGYYCIGICENPFCKDPWFRAGFNEFIEEFESMKKLFYKVAYRLLSKIKKGSYSKRLFFKAYERVTPSKTIIKKAIDLMEKRIKKKPLFVYLHLMDTHYPFGLDFSGHQKLRKLIKEKKSKELKKLMEDSLFKVDESIGLLLDLIKKRMPETQIVFISDHGDSFFEHGAFGHGHMKGLYQELVRIPLLVNKEFKFKKKEIERPVRIIDIFPTLMEANGLAKKIPKIDGKSLFPLVRGNEKKEREVLLESGNSHPLKKRRGDNQVGILKEGKWKLIYFKKSRKRKLFNIQEDPVEKHNLAETKKKIADELEKALPLNIQEKKVKQKIEYSKEELKKLKGLGYL